MVYMESPTYVPNFLKFNGVSSVCRWSVWLRWRVEWSQWALAMVTWPPLLFRPSWRRTNRSWRTRMLAGCRWAWVSTIWVRSDSNSLHEHFNTLLSTAAWYMGEALQQFLWCEVKQLTACWCWFCSQVKERQLKRHWLPCKLCLNLSAALPTHSLTSVHMQVSTLIYFTLLKTPSKMKGSWKMPHYSHYVCFNLHI